MSRTISEQEWNGQGEALFGADRMAWRFVCPSCGHVASVADWKAAGAPAEAAAFSCVGRWVGGNEAFGGPGTGPCNYAGGGLIGLNPVRVERGVGLDGIDRGATPVFEFAEVAP